MMEKSIVRRMMGYLTHALLICMGLSAACHAQQTQQVLGGLDRLPPSASQSARAVELMKQFRSNSGGSSDSAARELSELAGRLLESKKQIEAVNIAKDLFLSSAPADVRKAAYRILDDHASIYLAPHVTEIRVLVPNISCYGRFLESLQQSVRDKFDWVYDVRIRNTHRVQPVTDPGQLTIGTVAELSFIIDQSRTTRELAAALKSSQHGSIEGWTMLIEQPIDALVDEQP